MLAERAGFEMRNPGNEQKKVKLAIIILIILAVLVLIASCIGAGLSKKPAVSVDNPFAEQLEIKEENVFVRFWNNLCGFFQDEKDEEKNPDDVTDNGNKGNVSIENAIKSEDTVSRKSGFYNFLLVAKDKGGGNTDVIMVLSFDTENDKIAILQIPRDTYVNVPYSFKKINSVYTAGYNEAARKGGGSVQEYKLSGVEALEQAILKNFGIVIDRYVMVDIAAFHEIVDAIGGVDIYIQNDMDYIDIYQNLEIHLPKGQHHLDGKKAEGFVRYRSGYIDADIGRMNAQKIFMSAFLDKLFRVSTIAKIPELASHVITYLDTDISLSDAIIFGKQLFEVDMSEITMHNLQGEAGYFNGGAYFSVYEKANISLVNSYFNAFDKELSEEHVEPIMLTPEPADSTYSGGSSAEDINNDNPDLSYLY